MRFRVLGRILAFLLAPYGCAMMVPCIVGLLFREWREAAEFALAAFAALLVAALLWLPARHSKEHVHRREALAAVGLSWMAAILMGAVPFMTTGVCHYADAIYESASGLTTSGSTIFAAIEDLPKCVLFWRSFQHFLGGLGIVVLFVAALPSLGVGARALFKQESTGPVPEGMTPHIRDTSILLLKVYLILNGAETLMLWAAGMSFFDAVNHAMATIATGGFSTRNASVLAYASPAIEWIIIAFMFLSGTSFSLHADLLKGRFTYLRSSEFRAYVGTIAVASTLFAVLPWLAGSLTVSVPGAINVRDALFTNITLQSCTGFTTVDYDKWPEATRLLALLVAIVGGCAGSTSGGVKMIRWVVLCKGMWHVVARRVSPTVVRTMKVDGRSVPVAMTGDIFVFFFLYISVLAGGTFLMALLMPAQEILASFSAVVACINNVGPGLGAVGPAANFAGQSDAAKLLLSFIMLLGRLEFYPLLALCSGRLWSTN